MLTMLSYGGGQDSTTILHLLVGNERFRKKYAPEDLIVVMSDTGDEHLHTYTYVKVVARPLCWKHRITFVLIEPHMGFHTPSWQDLRQAYKSKSMLGSPAYGKTCTDKLKIVPIYKYLDWYVSKQYEIPYDGRKGALKKFAKIHGKVKVLLGIAKGEESRVSKAQSPHKWMRESIEKVYPLIDLGYDRSACQEYIDSVGGAVPWPSNCILCHYMSPRELLWLSRFMPDDLKDWVEMEKAKIANSDRRGVDPKKNYGVWGRISIMEKLAKAETKFGHLTDEELSDYKFSHGHCVKNAY